MKHYKTESIDWYTGEPESEGWYIVKYDPQYSRHNLCNIMLARYGKIDTRYHADYDEGEPCWLNRDGEKVWLDIICWTPYTNPYNTLHDTLYKVTQDAQDL